MSGRLPPGQIAILRSFARHGPDSLYQASDIMDLRVCYAMMEGGLLARMPDAPGVFELTPDGVKAMGQV